MRREIEMPILPAALTRQPEIQQAVAEVEQGLKPDVVFIHFDVRPDWDGDWAIYFRILLTDEAVEHRLKEIPTKVVRRLDDRFDFDALGLIPYHKFSSVSEQAAAGADAWQ
jgi:hypothetical protein